MDLPRRCLWVCGRSQCRNHNSLGLYRRSIPVVFVEIVLAAMLAICMLSYILTTLCEHTIADVTERDV